MNCVWHQAVIPCFPLLIGYKQDDFPMLPLLQLQTFCFLPIFPSSLSLSSLPSFAFICICNLLCLAGKVLYTCCLCLCLCICFLFIFTSVLMQRKCSDNLKGVFREIDCPDWMTTAATDFPNRSIGRRKLSQRIGIWQLKLPRKLQPKKIGTKWIKNAITIGLVFNYSYMYYIFTIYRLEGTKHGLLGEIIIFSLQSRPSF